MPTKRNKCEDSRPLRTPCAPPVVPTTLRGIRIQPQPSKFYIEYWQQVPCVSTRAGGGGDSPSAFSIRRPVLACHRGARRAELLNTCWPFQRNPSGLQPKPLATRKAAPKVGPSCFPAKDGSKRVSKTAKMGRDGLQDGPKTPSRRPILRKMASKVPPRQPRWLQESPR